MTLPSPTPLAETVRAQGDTWPPETPIRTAFEGGRLVMTLLSRVVFTGNSGNNSWISLALRPYEFLHPTPITGGGVAHDEQRGHVWAIGRLEYRSGVGE